MPVKDKDARILGEARQGAKAKGLHTAAKKLGSKGGKEGGPARAKRLSGARRKSIAIEGAEARWGKK